MDTALWNLLASIGIALLPALLHVIDKLLESISFSPINKETLRLLISGDRRIAHVGENKAAYEAVRTYFDFERDCHFIFVLTVFNLASVFVAQLQCTGSLFTFEPITFVMVVLLVLFFFVFLFWLLNRKIEPAAVGATDWYRRPMLIKWWKMVALVLFGLVIATEIYLHFFCKVT